MAVGLLPPETVRPSGPRAPVQRGPSLVGRARATRAMLTAMFPWLADSSQRTGRLVLAGAGFVPVSLVAVSCFGLFGLRDMALYVLLPALLLTAVCLARWRPSRDIVAQGLLAGLVATAMFDLLRFGFLWLGLTEGDPIPHIGEALRLQPAWLAGYVWRYLGNGTGLAVAFVALGLRGMRTGVLYGLFVCAGLLVTLLVSPLGEELLYPLSAPSIVMFTGGHLVYGAVLGSLVAKRIQRSETILVPTSTRS
ncbi:MAG: hypothetical protein ACRDTT_17110 [Pseudonocardiaceae bacterium]